MKDFSRPIADVVNARKSWRNYRNEPLDPHQRDELNLLVEKPLNGPLGSLIRFRLVDAAEQDRESIRKLGTYGFIKGAPVFLIGAVEANGYYLEDFGAVMERIILKATDMGLGTCWLGGFFDKSAFAAEMDLGISETVPAVTPIGYITEKRSAFDTLIRFGAGSKSRYEWADLFFDGAFERPLGKQKAGIYREALELVRLAPSASNKQPWRVVKDPDSRGYHFYLRRSKGYALQTSLIGKEDLQRIDMGIAMCHFWLTVQEIGIAGEWSVLAQTPQIQVPERTEYLVSWQGRD